MHDQFIDMTIFLISRDELTKFFQKIIFSKPQLITEATKRIGLTARLYFSFSSHRRIYENGRMKFRLDWRVINKTCDLYHLCYYGIKTCILYNIILL